MAARDDIQTSKSRAGREVCSFENEIERERGAKSKPLRQTPNRTDKFLSGAFYAPFEIHTIPLEGSKLYWNDRIVSLLRR